MKTKPYSNYFFAILSLCILPVIFLALPSGTTKKNISRSQRIPKMEQWVDQQMSKMTLDEKIGQLFMISVHPNRGEKDRNEVRNLVAKCKVGGLIYFQGEKDQIKKHIAEMQGISDLPMLVSMDAEWGTYMRIFDVERFPYAYSFGAAGDTALSRKIAGMMAAECREMGIHINFMPVADVNSDPKNPVIGFRSYGEDPNAVSEQVGAFVNGLEQNGVMSCIKHFPGHGNTDKDSHLELPLVSNSRNNLDAIDFKPFRKGIKAGTSAVMVAHLKVPSIDDSGLPTSLSKKVIDGLLRKEMSFNGLVFSDALNMKAVTNHYGKTEAVLKAFEAGCDILLCPESVEDAIQAIKQRVEQGTYSRELIEQRCRRILEAKYRYIISPKKGQVYSHTDVDWGKRQVYEKSLTVLKNEENILPLQRMDKKVARVSVGVHALPFRRGVDLFDNADHYHYYSYAEAIEKFSKKAANYEVIILGAHSNTVRTRNNYGFSNDMESFVQSLPSQTSNILVLFGNPLVLGSSSFDQSKFKGIILAYENHDLAQKTAAQFIYGAIPATGTLPFTINERWKRGAGIQVSWGGRLKFSSPEELGIDRKKLEKIDEIALNGIEKKAFPGCQIVVAVEGKIIYRKSFGKHTYEGTDTVKNHHLYDIASISKIAGSTIGVMKLQGQGKFSLNKTIGDYIPNLTSSYKDFHAINLRDMMAHQAGLTAWIAFYKKTLNDGKWNSSIYATEPKPGFDIQVAKDLYINNAYVDTIYRQIMTSKLGPKKYEYSDLGYYFIKKIIEKQSGRAFHEFLTEEIYYPLGLRSMRYRPLMHFDPSHIVPTEDDQTFRKQLLDGFVHDPGAAMLGGVGGHAGLFSNATDLASLMQMFLNKGRYGNVQFLSEEIVEEYTKAQFSGNRRGAGFDRPQANGGGSCHELASQQSFGHSGFTGTLVWADPKYQINYVFLSNRVCPSQDNWKIRDMNIRTEIQRVIYEAVMSKN
jgi:beta-N-acetylhexosaminidase